MKARQKIYRTQSLSKHVSFQQRQLDATRWDCVVSLGNADIGARGGGQH
jgi:hypothetical protein